MYTEFVIRDENVLLMEGYMDKCMDAIENGDRNDVRDNLEKSTKAVVDILTNDKYTPYNKVNSEIENYLLGAIEAYCKFNLSDNKVYENYLYDRLDNIEKQNKMTESFKSRKKYIRESKNSESFAEFISDVFNVAVKDENRIEKAIKPLFETFFEDDIDNTLLNKVKTKVLKIISEWYDFDLLGCDNYLRKAIKDYVLFKSTNDISYKSSLIDNLEELNEAIFNAFEYDKMLIRK